MTRLFGTNGIRGVVGPDMNAELAVKVGRSIGTFFGGGPVALARDTRLSGPMLARATASGLMSAGCEVIDLGIVPTPCAEHYVAKAGGTLKGAVVVTASHNPREFNGLKAIDARGMEMRREDEEAIESILRGTVPRGSLVRGRIHPIGRHRGLPVPRGDTREGRRRCDPEGRLHGRRGSGKRRGLPLDAVPVAVPRMSRHLPERPTGRSFPRPDAGADSRAPRRPHARRVGRARESRNRARRRCGPRGLRRRQRLIRGRRQEPRPPGPGGNPGDAVAPSSRR